MPDDDTTGAPTDADSMTGKVSFDDVYDRRHPDAYLRAMSAVDYQIPEHARSVFSHLARSLRDGRQDAPLTVLDLCCSYGINAALLNHDVTLTALYDRSRDSALASLPDSERTAVDRRFFADRRLPDAVPVVGLDAATNATAYALRVGLLDAGSSENLEDHDPSGQLKRHLANVGLITVTGGIGYITELTFDRLLGSVVADQPPWIAAFCLRWVDMAPIGEVIARYGMVLETLPERTFRQRRFANDDERRHAFARLRELGHDPEGVETDGYHHTTLFVARPQAAAAAVPLADVLGPAL